MKALISITVVAICIGMYFMYISPTYSDIQILRARKADYTSTLDKAKELAVRRDEVMATYSSISPIDLERLSKALPSTFDQVVFAKDLNALATAHGFTVKDLQVSIVPPAAVGEGVVLGMQIAPPYKTITVQYAVSGTYEQFVSYLKDVEKNLRLMDIHTVTIKTSDKGVYDYTIILTTYSLR